MKSSSNAPSAFSKVTFALLESFDLCRYAQVPQNQTYRCHLIAKAITVNFWLRVLHRPVINNNILAMICLQTQAGDEE